MARSISYIFVAALLATGCATAPTRNNLEARQPTVAALGDGAPSPADLDLLPMLDVVRTPFVGNTPSAVGGYVRFFVEGDPPSSGGSGQRHYGDEDRDALSRWLVGRTNSRVLTVKVAVQRPNVNGTATLASSSHESSSRVGETWATEVNGRRYLTPYFRVDPGTVVGVQVSLKASRQIQSDVTRRILDVVTRAATLVNPTGSLVTTLNSGRLQSSAEFVDQSISSLFGETLGESSLDDYAPGQWNDQPKEMATITASFPMGGRVVDENRTRQIGVWKVFASPALVSIFSTVPLHDAGGAVPAGCPAMGSEAQACRAFQGLAAHTVLGLQVGENLTLGQALLADATVDAALARLRGAQANQLAEPARVLCSAIAAKAEGLGLNRFDAAATVWAVARSALSEDQAGAMLASGTCGAAVLAGRIGLA
jgi:hypothetical protein